MGCFILNIHAQKNEDAVRSFGTNMQSWGQTSKLEYQKNLQKLCNGAKSVRVCDEIVESLAPKNGYTGMGGSYFLETYLNCLIKEIKKGIRIEYSNFKTINASETTAYDTRDLELIACDIVISGAVNYNVKDLFYVRNGKISKIDKYEETVDKRTGKRKIKVDLSDIEFADEAIAMTYNYSKNFPVGATFEYAWPWFRIGLDFGVNFKKDNFIVDDVRMTDIMNYERTTKTLDAKCFLTATPSLYMKYLSIGCGIGALFLEGTEEHHEYSISNTSQQGNSYSQDASEIRLMLRPCIKGFIPIADDDFAIIISAGYDYAFGYKKC
ncbi:MAG TPA: hypothetical protein DCW90_11385, partial [Lachnospiraceae bacterium]|nr:hypothetical protein [Lachnospiraceae bacterium]